ncbi:flagellar hook capping FlgD N-terminal domain-containing protein [Alicyclobacillus fodiniaquatilis]|jgi:flagellar basal-body rod modification protein FlgD|uniref:Flagellar hook capping FlgD N-terminal domain-containing protein n=1 Tax=Alicyclobacillus fodiniaquatilis TaxID=1661150 RepID=A0ABW4JE79_9BACL
MTTPITSSAGTVTNTQNTQNTQDPSSNPNDTLGEDSFLQLLVAQMQNQDPLGQSQDPTQFIGELAQFSSLEQMTDIANDESQLISTVQTLGGISVMSMASQMIGKQVTVDDGNGGTVTGQVSGVKFDQGSAQVTVNGTDYPLMQVEEMS